jgi:hypothetical protein
MLVPPGCPLQLLVPTHYKTKKKGTPMSQIVDNYCSQQGITNYSDYPTGIFAGVQYSIVPAIVRSNPKRNQLSGGELRLSDIQLFYNQKEGISLSIPNIPQPIGLWWQHINAHTERYPIIVWGNFDFGNRDFNSLFRLLRDKKRIHHIFALAKKETETDVGSTYALIKAYQSIQTNEEKKLMKRSKKPDQIKSKIDLRSKIVISFLKDANKVFGDAIDTCETNFSFPGTPIVSLEAINKIVIQFYHKLTPIYDWQYCLSVSARTSTLLNVSRNNRLKYKESSVHIGRDERFVLFSFFAQCRKRNSRCLKNWAIILSFNNMASGVQQKQQSITSNLGYQLAESSFYRYKYNNRKRVIAAQNKLLQSMIIGNFGCDNNHRMLNKKSATDGTKSNGFTGTTRIAFPIPYIPQETVIHLKRVNTQKKQDLFSH